MARKRTTGQRLVEAQRAVGTGRQEEVAGCKLIVIVTAGRYNDRQDRAWELGAGEELLTRAWYAEALVRDGFAEWPEVVEQDEADLAAYLARAEEAERALQEAAGAAEGGKLATDGDKAVGMAPGARRRKSA